MKGVFRPHQILIWLTVAVFLVVCTGSQAASAQQNSANAQCFLSVGNVRRPDFTSCAGTKLISLLEIALQKKVVMDACINLSNDKNYLPPVNFKNALVSYSGLDFAGNRYVVAALAAALTDLNKAVYDHDRSVRAGAGGVIIGPWTVSNALDRKGSVFQKNLRASSPCYALGCAVDIRLITYSDKLSGHTLVIPPIESSGAHARVDEMWKVISALYAKHEICAATNNYLYDTAVAGQSFHIESWASCQ